MASIVVRSPAPYGHIPAAAAAIRLIGRRHSDAHRVCEACEVTWTGPSDECWSCGQPTLTAYTGRGALRTLLRATDPARRRRPEEW